MGVEEGAGLQVATQLALHDVAHGAVVRQPDEGRGVHEVGATEGQSHAAATGQRPLIPRALPVSQKTLHHSQLGEKSAALASAPCILCGLVHIISLGEPQFSLL